MPLHLESLSTVKAPKEGFKYPRPTGRIRWGQRLQFLGLISKLEAVAEDDEVGASLIRGIEIQYNAGPARIRGMDALTNLCAFSGTECTWIHNVDRHAFGRKGLVSVVNYL